MKVFSRDKYIENEGLADYCFNASLVDKCHMHTGEECIDMGMGMGMGIRNDWSIPCREVQRRAKTGEYVYITEHNFDKTFSPGDVVKCVNDKMPVCVFKNENGEQSTVDKSRYVVREIVEEEEKMENVKRSFKLIPGKHIVKTRHGKIYLLVEGTDMKLTGIGIKHKGYVAFDLDNDLKDSVWHDFDIMEVFEFDVNCWENITNDLKSVWKRKEEAKEMTVAEIEKLLGHKVKIIKEGK